VDGRVRIVFLPIAVHFAARLLMEFIPLKPTTLQLAESFSWNLSQLLAAVLLVAAFQSGSRMERSVGVAILIVASAVAMALVIVLQPQISRPTNPLELGLATLFALAAASRLGPQGRDDWRGVWLGSSFALLAFAHFNLAWSTERFDSPFMWAQVLLGVGLVIPLAGAIRENATLLISQTALSDRLQRHRRSTEVILDGLPVVVLSVDQHLRVRYANRTASLLLGVTRGVTVGDPDREWLERFHPPDRSRIQNAIPATIDRGSGGWEAVVRVVDTDGGVHWLNTQLHPMVDPGVNQTLVQLVATDVTELFLARRTAEARQTRMAFLSNVAQTVAGEVSDQRILERFLELGQEIYPLVSLLLYRPLPDQSSLRLEAAYGPGADAFERDRRESIRTGHPCGLTFRDGFPRSASLTETVPTELAQRVKEEHGISHVLYLPLLAAGRVVGVLATTTTSEPELDTTEIELLTQVGYLLGGAVYLSQLVHELDEQRAVAMEASRLKSEFLANTSHELRTPLTAILGFLQLVIDGAVENPEKQQEFLKIAHESADKLLTIINDVLDLAKIEAGRLEVHEAPVPVRKILDDIQALFCHQMKGQGLDFAVAKTPSKLVLWADQDRTVQILTNLLSNAMKFTQRGGRISVECEADDGEVAFSVRDTGSGIPPEELDTVFDSFYQVDGSTTRQHGGTGLGLTISRRLAEMMGGTLELQSPGIDAGTTATLSLREYRAEQEIDASD
jgi:PAS domain S-box-containing protein